MKYTRITVNPNQMNGVPCIRGLRIPVATVVGMIAEGMTEKEILEAYPDLEQEDIREALQYAAEAVRERELPLVNAVWSSWWIMPSHLSSDLNGFKVCGQEDIRKNLKRAVGQEYQIPRS